MKFEPGIEFALERYQRLQKIRAGQACRRTVDHPKAMRELHRQEDVGGSVARRLYADAVPLEGDVGVAAPAVDRGERPVRGARDDRVAVRVAARTRAVQGDGQRRLLRFRSGKV